MIDGFLYSVLIIAGKCAAAVRPAMLWRLSGAAGVVFYRLHPEFRRVVHDNSKIICNFRGKNDDVGRMAVNGARNMGRLAALSLAFPFQDPDELVAKTKVSGLKYLKAAVKDKGAIVLTAHLGHWERLGAFLSGSGFEIWAFYLRPRQYWVKRWLSLIRERAHVIPLERENLKKALRVLKNGGILGILADHDGGPRGMIMDFLGQKASVPTGPAALALRTGAAVVPCYCIPGNDNTAVIRFYPPVNISPESPGVRSCNKDLPGKTRNDRVVRAEALKKAVRRINREYEKIIMKYPEHWLLAYDRFKPRRHVPA